MIAEMRRRWGGKGSYSHCHRLRRAIYENPCIILLPLSLRWEHCFLFFALAVRRMMVIGLNQSWLHPDKFEYLCRPLNDPLPAEPWHRISAPRHLVSGDREMTVIRFKQLASFTGRSIMPTLEWPSSFWDYNVEHHYQQHQGRMPKRYKLSYPLVNRESSQENAFQAIPSLHGTSWVIYAGLWISPLQFFTLRYVPATSYKRIDLSSQLIYFRLIIIMALLSYIRRRKGGTHNTGSADRAACSCSDAWKRRYNPLWHR
jgi:hypothetical protein